MVLFKTTQRLSALNPPEPRPPRWQSEMGAPLRSERDGSESPGHVPDSQLHTGRTRRELGEKLVMENAMDPLRTPKGSKRSKQPYRVRGVRVTAKAREKERKREERDASTISWHGRERTALRKAAG